MKLKGPHPDVLKDYLNESEWIYDIRPEQLDDKLEQIKAASEGLDEVIEAEMKKAFVAGVEYAIKTVWKARAEVSVRYSSEKRGIYTEVDLRPDSGDEWPPGVSFNLADAIQERIDECKAPNTWNKSDVPGVIKDLEAMAEHLERLARNARDAAEAWKLGKVELWKPRG